MLVVGQRIGTVRFYGTTKFAPGDCVSGQLSSSNIVMSCGAHPSQLAFLALVTFNGHSNVQLLPMDNPVICFSISPNVEPENPTQSKLSKAHNVARPAEPISKQRIQAAPTWQADTKPWQEDIGTDTVKVKKN